MTESGNRKHEIEMSKSKRRDNIMRVMARRQSKYPRIIVNDDIFGVFVVFRLGRQY